MSSSADPQFSAETVCINCGFPDFISTTTIFSILSQYQHYLILQEITVHPVCSGFQAVESNSRGFEISHKNFKDFLHRGNLNFFSKTETVISCSIFPIIVFATGKGTVHNGSKLLYHQKDPTELILHKFAVKAVPETSKLDHQ